MANQVIIDETRNQISVIEGQTRIIEVAAQGPQGPVGPRGETGPSGSSILNQITSGSVTASVDTGYYTFRVSNTAQPYLSLAYETSGVLRHQNSTPPYFTLNNNNAGVNLNPGQAVGYIEIGGARAGSVNTMVRFSTTYIGDGNSRNARLSLGTAEGTGFGGNQISIFKLSSGSFLNRAITVIGANVDSYSTSSIDITGLYASRATTIIGAGSGNNIVSFDSSGLPQTVLFSNGNWGINTFSDGGEKLQVTGTTRLAGNTTITGSLLVTGNITAQTLVVQTITSSVLYSSGSNIFGNSLTNTQDFTGSVRITGSASITGGDLNIVRPLSSGPVNNLFSISYTHPGYNSGNITMQQYYNSTSLSFVNTTTNATIYLTGTALSIETQNVGSINSISRYHYYNTTLSGGIYNWSFQSSTAMRLNANGNLIIGTTNDDGVSKLQVSGSVSFNSGSGFNWDGVNNRLGIGTSTPGYNLHVYSNIGVQSGGFLTTIGTGVGTVFTSGQTTNIGRYFSLYADSADVNLTSGADTTGRMTFAPRNNSVLRIYGATGNVVIQNGGTFTDSGERLQVSGSSRFVGDIVITGSGNTSATNALLIKDSTSNNLFSVRNNGTLTIPVAASQTIPVISIFQRVGIGNNNAYIPLLKYGHTVDDFNQHAIMYGFWSSSNVSGFRFSHPDGSGGGGVTFNFIPLANQIQSNVVNIQQNLTATSGGNGINQLLINPTINQTGGANGVTRGLYIAPTLTAAADWRSIQWDNNAATAPSASWGLYGAGTAPNYINGNLLVGTTSDTGDKLNIGGTIRTTGNAFFGNYVYGTYVVSGLVGVDTAWNFNFGAGSIRSGGVLLRNFGLDAGNPPNGNVNGLQLSYPFTGATSTFTNASLLINNTINQTSGTGITRGIYLNPTLTLAADWRSIEWTNNASGSTSWGLYGSGSAPNYLSGSLLIGSASNSGENLQVYGTMKVNGITTINNAVTIGTPSTGGTQLVIQGSFTTRLSIKTSSTLDGFSGTILNSAIDYTNNDLIIASKAVGTTSNIFVLPSTYTYMAGNVLIGTTSNSGERLQVSGSVKITDGLVVTGSITSLNSIYSNGLLFTPAGIFCDNNLARFRHVTVGVNQGAGTGFIQPEDGTQSIGIRTGTSFGGTTRLLVTSTGNILINNTTDDTVNRLQVSGSSRFFGNMVVTGSATITGRVDIGTITGGAPGTVNINNTIVLYGTASSRKIINSDGSSGIYFGSDSMSFLYYGSSISTYEFSWGNSPGGGMYIKDVNSGTRNVSAKLQVDSTTLGFLPPRMTTAQKNAISTPAAGLVVYDTTLAKLCVYTTTWETITSS
jgi:hypothetical protein